jgi:transcription initiation factor TFIID subunit 3
MSTATLHHALLRPAVLQILRAAGFHSARSSVVDTLTEITARYITLLASRSAAHAYQNHNDYTPDVTDVRLALGDAGLLVPSLTSTEEVWREILRKPLEDIPERNGLRAMEAVRRNEEDTNEIVQFVAWFQGPMHHEIKRIAGLLTEEGQAVELEEVAAKEDYLTGSEPFIVRVITIRA